MAGGAARPSNSRLGVLASLHGENRESVLACVCYALSSIALSLTNKGVFSIRAFDYPSSVLMTQAIVTVGLLWLLAALRIIAPLPFDPALARRMAPVTVMFAAMLWTSSRAFRYCSVPVVTVFKNLSVVAITIWELLVYGQTVPSGVALSLVFMMIGSAVAAMGDADLAVSARGYGWLVLNILFTVAHVATIRVRLPRFSSPAAKTLHNQLLACVLFAFTAAIQARHASPFTVCLGQHPPLSQHPTLPQGELRSYPSAVLAQPPSTQIGLALSAVLGLLINLCTFWCLRVASGSTYSFVGATNKVPVAVLGHFFFSSGLSTLGWVGVAFGLVAGLAFSVAKAREVSQEHVRYGRDAEAAQAMLDEKHSGRGADDELAEDESPTEVRAAAEAARLANSR